MFSKLLLPALGAPTMATWTPPLSLSPRRPSSRCASTLESNSLTSEQTTDKIKPGSQYDTGAYVASVASSLVHNMTLELT